MARPILGSRQEQYHTYRMANPKFEIVLLKDMTYGVEVLLPGQEASCALDTFVSRAEAQRWIADRIRFKDMPTTSVDNHTDDEASSTVAP